MLRLAPLDEISDDSDKSDYGSTVHAILEEFHEACSNHDPALIVEIEDAWREERLREIAERIFAERIANNPDFLGWRARWMPLVAGYVAWWREWTERGWRFAAAGGAVDVVGARRRTCVVADEARVDRIDQRRDDALAILDYKARSAKTLKEEAKEFGEDVQLPFYRLLMGAAAAVDTTGYLSVDRGNVELAVTIAQPALDALTAEVGDRSRRDWQRLHDGTPMPAQGIRNVCRYADMRGLCRKGTWIEGDIP